MATSIYLSENELSDYYKSESYIQQNLDYCTYYGDEYVKRTSPHKIFPDNEFSEYWAHLELGAGNYGLDGHTKISQNMTVLMEFKFVSKAYNYIDELPTKNSKRCNPLFQYLVLFQTLDKLVNKYGPKGIFHVNDLYDSYAAYAAYYLTKYAYAQGYSEIKIETIPGDYTKILPQKSLAQYNKTFYDSLDLKNIEESFFNYGMDGEKMLYSNESREHARIKLQKLANFSWKGLNFFPLFNGNYIPKEEKEEYIEKGIFYTPSQEEPVPYIFPEGDIVHPRHGAAYKIKPDFKCNYRITI